jgi:hypothetical protein
MHGILFTALKKYVRARLGDEAWNNLRTAAGLGGRVYLPVQPYPEPEFHALIATVAQLSGISDQHLLEDFGRFTAPDFLAVYRALLKPDWRTLDLLERIEETIHPIVRTNNPGATPPVLKIHRPTATQLEIRYDSPRQLCALGKGLIHGVADHFGEQVTITEPTCLRRGDPECHLIIT